MYHKPKNLAAVKLDHILDILRYKFIEFIARKEDTLSEEVTMELYSHLQKENFFPELVTFMAGARPLSYCSLNGCDRIGYHPIAERYNRSV